MATPQITRLGKQPSDTFIWSGTINQSKIDFRNTILDIL